VPDDWEPWVVGAVGASFAARSGWLASLSQARPSHRIRILCARRNGRLAGAVPVAISRRLGFTWARSLPFGTYGGPLVSAGEVDPVGVRARLASAFAAWLATERVVGGEVVHAPLVEGARPDERWLELAAEVTTGTSHVVDLSSGPGAVLRRLDRKTRQGFTRAAREGVEVDDSPEALPSVYELYLGQARSWGGHRPYSIAFLRALLSHSSGFARLHSARREGRVVAGVLALSGGGETFAWWSGASEEARRSLAYPYLMWKILEASAQAGQSRFNLGSSGGRQHLEQFKRSLGGEPRPLFVYHLLPARADWAFRLLAGLRAARRRV
jgi:CelD/BcsL family acetyltransferase involved in cellulose biosynthesis